jgi:superfamily II DNA or RNA helicase
MIINESLHNDSVRTLKVANIVKEKINIKKSKIMVLFRYVAPCYELQRRIPDSVVITGKESNERVKDAFDKIRNGTSRIVIGTIGCLSTGISIVDLTHIIIASPMGNNDLMLKQIRGRLMRKADEKEIGTLVYIHDENIFGKRAKTRFINSINN